LIMSVCSFYPVHLFADADPDLFESNVQELVTSVPFKVYSVRSRRVLSLSLWVCAYVCK
jgi:hypothetical protein